MDNLKMEELPEPIGNFIIEQNDLNYLQLPDGRYWHYKDVVTMLSRFLKSGFNPDPTPSSTEVMREALKKIITHCDRFTEPVIAKIAEQALSHTSQPEGAKGEDWISVKDGLPPKEDKFYYWLYSEKYDNYEQGEYDYDRKCFVDKYGDSLWYITHWKVPKPPGSFKK